MMRTVIIVTFGLSLAMALVACGGGSGQTPVIDKSPYRVIPAETKVLPEDSIYSLAWRFGLDYQDIAEWNGLAAPYKIVSGQSLRLRSSSDSSGSSQAGAVSTALIKSATKSVTKSVVKPKPVETTTATQVSSPAVASGQWGWPAKGKVIGKFSRSKGQNGIQIAGAAGSAIRATAAGEVVYAGEGLRGYGKLVIVKHSPTYLSAYAHNRNILVAEGDRIQSGQQIAQMGSSGTDRTMLHFEIRKDGKPVDPLGFLR